MASDGIAVRVRPDFDWNQLQCRLFQERQERGKPAARHIDLAHHAALRSR